MNERPRVGVGVIIKKNDYVLLGLRRSIRGKGSWSFPGGKLKLFESIEECAQRETFEECGIVIKNIRTATVTNDLFKSQGQHFITIFVVSDWAENEPIVKEPGKCEEWKWFKWNELPTPLFLSLENLLKQEFDPFKYSQV